MAGMVCDCCHRPEQKVVGVASSGFIAMSFAWCGECLQQHVEPEWVLSYLYYEVGDHGENLIADEHLPGTWKDGRYWTWEQWKDWARTQPDPMYDLPETEAFNSSLWTGRRPRNEADVPQWLLHLAWPLNVAPWDGRLHPWAEPPQPRWRYALRRLLALCWGWD